MNDKDEPKPSAPPKRAPPKRAPYGVGAKIGPWTVTASEVVYDNPWIKVIDHGVVHPDGSNGQYGVVSFKNRAIGVLAIDAEGMVTMVGQHRFPHDAYSWELPEGGGPLDESPLVAAKRELAEETGFTADHWLELCEFDISNSVTDETAKCFLAWGLKPGEAQPEPSEALAYDRLSFLALHERVLDGHVRDSMTIIMTLAAASLAHSGRLPAEIADLIGRR